MVYLGRPALLCCRAVSRRLRHLLAALLCCLAAAGIPAPDAAAQSTTQQRVYGAQGITPASAVISAYNKDSQTGALGPVSGAPFPEQFEGGLVAIDGLGKFLFVLNPQNDTISMFQIDAATGALTEVPHSPFATGPTINPNQAPSQPISIAAEPTGHYLYVGYAVGNIFPNAAVTPLAIDTANLQLTLTPGLSYDISGTPVQMLSDPKGLHLYVALGPNTQSGQQLAGTTVYSIDPGSGALFQDGTAGGGTTTGRCIAIDPQGRFFFDGWGVQHGFIDSGPISPVDGTSSISNSIDLGTNDVPAVLLVDSSAKFLYAGTTLGVMIYSIDQTTGKLTQVQGPLSTIVLDKGHAIADPMGPFLYSLDSAGVHAYQIDSQSGALTEIAGSPFNSASGGATGPLGIAVTVSQIQTVVGPVAQLFPASSDLGQATVGQPSVTRIISLANTGDQTLAIGGITITGANAADFSQTNTCLATLAPNANCSISLSFVPTLAAVESATLNVSDNAPGSPQTATLTGTGVAATSAVTASPGSLDFGAVALGGSVPAKTIVITSSGTAALHVGGVALGGANPGDFTQTNNCTAAPLAVQATCAISVSFAPQAEGQRSATITLTDDAPNSPQTFSIAGSVTAPFQLGAASSGSTSASISAGQTAAYALQIAPGAGFTGNVTFACTGAPQAAACAVNPTTLLATGGAVTPFAVSVTTTGSASFIVPLGAPRPRPPLIPPFSLIAAALAFFFFVFAAKRPQLFAWNSARLRAAVCGFFLLFACVALDGCGGGSTAAFTTPATPPPPPPTPPAPVVTPPGTYSLTVTAIAGNLPAQTITLTLTVR